jgi:hypothetical protein
MTRRGWLDRQMDRAERQMEVWKKWEEGDMRKPSQAASDVAASSRLELVGASDQKRGERNAPSTVAPRRD